MTIKAQVSGSKGDRVYALFRNRVASGKWVEGELIPTEKELVAELNCSRSTVGKALTRLAREGVLERKTRAGTRVIQKIGGTGGVTPIEEKRLSLDALAFIYPSAQHEGIRRIMDGFQAEAHSLGRRVLMLSTGTDPHRETEIVKRLDEFDVRGVAIYPFTPGKDDYLHYIQMVFGCAFPVVFAGITLPATRRPGVLLDGFHAGYTMGRYLAGRGVRRIGFLANYAWTHPTREKFLGYRHAMEEADLGDALNYVMLEQEMQPNFPNPVEGTEAIGMRYLERFPDVEAVLCSSDFLAIGLMRAAARSGRSVPGDLKIVGTSGFHQFRDEPIGLTTYHTPFEEIGSQAFRLLDACEDAQEKSAFEELVKGYLVERESA